MVCFFITTLFSILYFSTPSLTNFKKDIQSGEKVDSTLQKALYIASAESEFKDAVAKKITNYFIDKKIKVVGISIDSLASLQKDKYEVLVVMNSCWGGKVQKQVGSFLDQIQDQGNIIVLTTSKNGDWLPDMEKWDFDAIATASKSAEADSVSSSIIEKLNILLKLE